MARKRRKKDRGSNRRGVICISTVVMVLLVLMFVQSNTLKEKNTIYLAREDSIKGQIEAEKQRTKEIDDLKAYMNTKEYAEEVARDKLGLVYQDEILFKQDK